MSPTGWFPTPFRHSLRWRLPLVVTAVIAVTLAAFVWAAYREVERALLDGGRARASNAANELVTMLGPATQERSADMARLVRTPELQAIVNPPVSGDVNAVTNMLRTELPGSRQIIEVWRANGQLVLSVAMPPAVESVFPRPQPPAQAGLRLQKSDAGPVIADTIEAIGAAGAPAGFLVVRRPVATSSPDVLNKLVGDGARIHIGGTQGQWTDLVDLISPSPAEAAAAPGAAAYTAPDGEGRIAGVGAIRGTPFLVSVDFPQAVFLAPARSFLTRTSAIALLLVLLSGLAARVTTARMTKPLGELTDATELVAAGDLTVQVQPKRQDELGRLGHGFNAMVVQIREAQHHLQQARDAALGQASRARIVAEVATALTEGQDLKAMLQRCVEALVTHLDASGARIWTAAAHEQVLELQAAAGPVAVPDQRLDRVPFGVLAIGRIAATQQPFIDNDVDPREYLARPTDSRDLRSYAGYPLVVGGRLVGTVSLFGRAPFSEETIQTLGAVARTIALGIERKRSALQQAKLEEQLVGTQKIEAIGQLAGGLAHDFNNLLTIILGFANSLEDQLAQSDPRRRDVEQILRAGERGAQLTRQLLAFSRKQVLQPVVINPASLLRELEPMLAGLLGETITLTIDCARDTSAIRFDRAQLELILVNLVMNARDAMPNGGRLAIDTADVDLDEEFCRTHVACDPGRYVRLSVTDNGVGIDDETRKRIFEPFFTTKPRNKGTGLGLATVFGILKQSGGSVWVYSEPGFGATFKVFLPIADAAEAAAATSVVRTLAPGSESVLICEDEPGVRLLTETVLKRAGYQVAVVGHPHEALKMAAEPERTIDLLVTDVVLPDMNGAALARDISQRRPGLRVLYMSGFADDIIESHGVEAAGAFFLQKPFTGHDLAEKVREVLNAPSRLAQ